VIDTIIESSIAHTCPYRLVGDVQPCERCMLPHARNSLKFFLVSMEVYHGDVCISKFFQTSYHINVNFLSFTKE
jgi:hypothetical protein